MVILKTGLPRTLKLRILKQVSIDGQAAYPGDVWTVPVADALGMIEWGHAERLDEPPFEVHEAIEIYSNSPDDAPAKLISRLAEKDRPKRAPVPIPLNGHLQGPEILVAIRTSR